MPWHSHATTGVMRGSSRAWRASSCWILDDWGLATQGRDILEIVEDRHNRGSTIVTSQLPVDHWHEATQSSIGSYTTRTG
jgi:DNA replication protein DnaC